MKKQNYLPVPKKSEMINPKLIDEQLFMDALTYAFKESTTIDLTDYDTWQGYRELMRFAYKCLDRRAKWSRNKISKQKPVQYKKHKILGFTFYTVN